MAQFRYGDHIAEAVGIDPKDRQLNTETLFLATEKTPGAYWLQLVVATGIAYMGLTLDSTAVLIGAMLVSPLMMPIVQVGMGFAMGHLHLTLRAGRRLLSSIALVIALSASAAALLPFTEPTREILARTQPTMLDLVVALFCGLAAAFTTARGSKDTVTAAAGTAIAIALVPPLCVVGFGVGTGSGAIAGGASLLFTANLAAIILVGDLFFLLTGFARADLERLEQRVYDDADREHWLYRFAKWIPVPGSVSRSLSLRALLPLTFVALVAIPLSQALRQVLWQVRVKGAIGQALDKFEREYRVIQRALTVAPDAVSLRLSVVGEPSQRDEIAEGLRRRLAAASGLADPVVTVDVVPDEAAVRRRLNDSRQALVEQIANLTAPQPTACPPVPAPVDLDALRTRAQAEGRRAALAALTASDHLHGVHDTVKGVLAWAVPPAPEGTAWLGWSLATGDHGTVLTLQQLADPPGTPGVEATLTNVLHHETGLALTVRVAQTPRTLIDSADAPTPAATAQALAALADHALAVQITRPAVEGPGAPTGRALKALVAARDQLAAAAAPLGDRATFVDGDRWRVRVTLPDGPPPLGGQPKTP